MSWHYLQGQEGEYLEDCCTGGEPLPPLRSKTTHAEFFCNGKLTESYLASLSGTMSAHLTGDRGKEGLMLSREDSPVRTFQQPEKAKGWRAKGRGYGLKWRGSSAKYDRNTHSWKIAQCSQDEDLTLCSWIWPKSGMMRSGQCWELTMSEHHTEESGSGFWPTPTVSSGDQVAWDKTPGQTGGTTLGGAVRWPTPTVAEATKISACANYGQIGLNNHPRIRGLPDRPRGEKDRRGGTKTRQTFPTPRAQDSYERRNRKTMERIVREGGDVTLTTRIKTEQEGQGQLNPDWVEWLMGWPIGWTSLEPLPEWSFRAWVTGFLTE